MTEIIRFRLKQVGSAARRLLGAGFAGRVLAVFRRSFYVEGRGGGIACLAPASFGMGPLTARYVPSEGIGRSEGIDWPEEIDWKASGLRPGAPAFAEGGRLIAAGRFLFDFAGARPWRPEPLPRLRSGEDFARGLEALAARAEADAPPDGLGRLIPGLLRGATGPDFGRGVSGSVLRRAWIGARALGEWEENSGSRNHPAGDPPPAAEGLLGLGPGLTPSGDDFLGGVLIALRALGRGAAADRLAAWALPRARRKTSVISFAHLAGAAEGEGAAALHRALGALFRPGAAGLSGALARLDALGHTSGWDALAGAALAGAWERERKSSASAGDGGPARPRPGRREAVGSAEWEELGGGDTGFAARARPRREHRPRGVLRGPEEAGGSRRPDGLVPPGRGECPDAGSALEAGLVKRGRGFGTD